MHKLKRAISNYCSAIFSRRKITTDIGNRPTMVFDTHFVCNQRCSYCVAGSKVNGDFGNIVIPEYLTKFKKFFKEYGPFNIVFTGGEPLITPNIKKFFKFLVKNDHIISLQTNLSAGLDIFLKSVPPECTGWILASFHSVALKQSQRFIENAKTLKTKGYPLVVKFVLDDVMVNHFESLCDAFQNHGIGTYLSPLIIHSIDKGSYPREYSLDEWSRMTPRFTLRSCWLRFAGGWKSRNALCYAGSRCFYARAWNGSISGCGHSFPTGLGDLYTESFSPLNKQVKCGLDICICDFNYYIGIIPSLDDTISFRELSRGNISFVTYDEYVNWIEHTKIKPVLNLDHIVSRIYL